MKKILVTLNILFLSLSLFASVNEQKIYSADSSLYYDIETLYLLSSHASPSSSSPWSENELRLMLREIDKNVLSEEGQELYDSILYRLNEEGNVKFPDSLTMNFAMEANLEMYVHRNSESFIEWDDWFHSFSTRKPFLRLYAEAWPVKNFYAYFELTLQNNLGVNTLGKRDEYLLDNNNNTIYNLLYKNRFNINIPIINDWLFSPSYTTTGEKSTFASFDATVPYKALFAAGGDHWSLSAGRDKLSWGNGTTGNLMLSSTFPRHTYLSFSTYFKSFNYSLLFSIFPEAQRKEDASESFDGYKALIVHRLEGRFFSDKLSLALNEACMFWSGEGQNFVLFQVNPFGLMHDEYIASNANSLLILEADWTIFKGFNVYVQVGIDDFTLPNESKKDVAANGFLLGIKYVRPCLGGIMTHSLEGVYTDPFMYIRGMKKTAESKYLSGYGYDAYFRNISSDRIILEKMFITYPYGNDSIVLDYRCNYKNTADSYNLGAEVMFKVHGSMDENSLWNVYEGKYNNAPLVSTPTTFNPFEDYDPQTGKITKHPIEYSLVVSLKGEYKINKIFSVALMCDNLFVWNKDNRRKSFDYDPELTLTFSASL